MSKTSSCIQMLTILKARGFITREELAHLLHTNIRNIIEYKKELENCGYVIESTTGKYGGYSLVRSTLLPVNSFTNDELRALQEARYYLKSHVDYLLYNDFERALDKMQASASGEEKQSGVYMQIDNTISQRMIHAIHVCEQAIKLQHSVEIRYRSLHALDFETVQIHPYELINYKGSYYMLGYSLKVKDYRMYKFSEERMRDFHMLDKTFQRDSYFRLKDHIGKSGLVKDEPYEIELYIYNETARRIAEQRIGIEPIAQWIDENTLYLKTIMEGKIDTVAFLLSLKDQCLLISPKSLKQEMLEIIEDMKKAYSNS